jgi:hypothetical protein
MKAEKPRETKGLVLCDCIEVEGTWISQTPNQEIWSDKDGLTAEMSPAQENLWLGVAVVREPVLPGLFWLGRKLATSFHA